MVLVVADGVKALDGAIVSSRLFVGRQYCVVHLKRSMKRSEREELDEILFLGEQGVSVDDKLGVLNYLVAPRGLWKWLKSNNLVESFNSLVERRRFGKFHSPWRILQIALAIAVEYNPLNCFLILVIILHNTLFLSFNLFYCQLFFHRIVLIQREYYNSQWKPESP